MSNNFDRTNDHASQLRAAVSRRRFLAAAGAVGVGAMALGPLGRAWSKEADAAPNRPRVAVIATSFHLNSHAHVILENFLEPYLFNGKSTDSGVTVASLFLHQQTHPKDMSRDVSAKYKIPIFPTIDAALCLGGDKLAVDAVLIIAEQGTYPVNAKGQTEYPRKQFFDEVVKVFERSGKVVPIFNDKHFSYRWDWAKEMYDTAVRMKIPFMAGSSVPLAQRKPSLEIKDGSVIKDAVSIHSGPLEAYGIHALEVMQSFVEARAGGETGVREVQYLEKDALWAAAKDGLWSPEVAAAAMAAELGPEHRLVKSVTNNGKAPGGEAVDTSGILVRYRDGLNGMAMIVSRNSSTRWNFACRLPDAKAPTPTIGATALFGGHWQNRGLFKALSHAIQSHFRTGVSPYPVERTLLTTGIVAAAMDSFAEKGKAIETPNLAITYKAKDFRAFREMGDTWKIIDEKTPAPEGIGRVGL